MFTEQQQLEVRDYLENVEGRVYIGCDSVGYKKFNKEKNKLEKWAKYAVAIAIHINNRNGCKAFHYVVDEINHDSKENKPRLRLMAEVYKSVEAYSQFEDLLIDREVEIHLDVNPDHCHESNSVAKQAVGYVKGVTGIDADIKPNAFAGSYLADHIARGKPMPKGFYSKSKAA